MRYVVRHHTEEFGCPECGRPVYVGDSAYEDEAADVCYCSTACAGESWRREEREVRASAARPGKAVRP